MSAKLGALLERLEQPTTDELRTIAAALANLLGASDRAGRRLGAATSRRPSSTGASAARSSCSPRARTARARVRGPALGRGDAARPDRLPARGAPRRSCCSARFGAPELDDRSGPRCARAASRLVAPALRPRRGGERGAARGAPRRARLPPAPAPRRCSANAGGNPLFLEETVRMLADAGVLDGEGDLDELAVPTSLQAMIGARLDGLPAARQAGRPARVGRRDDVLVGRGRRRCTAARRRGRPEPRGARAARRRARADDASSLADEREWDFKHGLIKDVAYARVPKGRRAPPPRAASPTGSRRAPAAATSSSRSSRTTSSRRVEPPADSRTAPSLRRSSGRSRRSIERPRRRSGARASARRTATTRAPSRFSRTPTPKPSCRCGCAVPGSQPPSASSLERMPSSPRSPRPHSSSIGSTAAAPPSSRSRTSIRSRAAPPNRGAT